MSGMYICFIFYGCGYYIKNRKNKKTASFAECYYHNTRQSNHFSIFWKKDSPSAITLTLGEVWNFAECRTRGTRHISKLRRVPTWQHSAKLETSPSAASLALGEVWIFAECHASGTRQSFRPSPVRPSHSPVPFASLLLSVPFQLFFAEYGLAHGKGLPSAREKPASPVEERSCALRRVLHSTKKLPSVCDTQQSPRVR